MKIKTILIFLFVSQLLIAQQNEQRVDKISVQGTVELREPADQASLSFSVQGTGSTLRQTVENANHTTRTIVDKLIGLGIKEKNIATSSFYSGENYGDKAFLSSSRDYKANITTLIKIDSLILLEAVILTMSEANVQNISQIEFSLKDEAGFRRRARIEAALKAKEKAEDMAKTLNSNLGKVISISEFSPTQIPGVPNPFNPSYTNTVVTSETVVIRGGASTGFFAKMVSITSSVYVSFEIK